MPNFHSNFQNFLARGFSGSRLFPTHDSEFITGLDFCYVFLIRLMFFKRKVYRQYYRLVSHPNVHCRTNNQKCSCECEHVQVHFWLFCIGLVPNICVFQFQKVTTLHIPTKGMQKSLKEIMNKPPVTPFPINDRCKAGGLPMSRVEGEGVKGGHFPPVNAFFPNLIPICMLLYKVHMYSLQE